MLLPNRRALTMKMVFAIFIVVGCVAVAYYTYLQATESLFAKAVVETYGEAYKIAFHAGKALSALPESSSYEYKTMQWALPTGKDCTISITSRMVKIKRPYKGLLDVRWIDAKVPLPVPLVMRATRCTAEDGCSIGEEVVKANPATGVPAIYTYSVKFESQTKTGIESYDYNCGDKLRFDKFKENGWAGTAWQYEKLWVRKI